MAVQNTEKRRWYDNEDVVRCDPSDNIQQRTVLLKLLFLPSQSVPVAYSFTCLHERMLYIPQAIVPSMYYMVLYDL